jgi:hypothetical protein
LRLTAKKRSLRHYRICWKRKKFTKWQLTNSWTSVVSISSWAGKCGPLSHLTIKFEY